MSENNNQHLLDLFQHLRVADVRDGMDWLMLHYQGSMQVNIQPIWRTRAIGIARTVRYVPYTGKMPGMTPDEYTQWQGWYYAEVCPYPWMDEIVPGDFIVIDQSEANVGLCGSNNTLAATQKGAKGFVTNGGVRDTDELILQKIPFWSKFCSQPMVQGRLQYDNRNIPIQVGGVTVFPGDIVVADGDGVIVVPRKFAVDVAKYSTREFVADKAARRKMYLDSGRELDDSVR